MNPQALSNLKIYIWIILIAIAGGGTIATLAGGLENAVADVKDNKALIAINTQATNQIGIIQTEIKYIRESISDIKTQQRIDKTDILRAINRGQ